MSAREGESWGRSQEDLTGRARIRDAALAHFAEHGIAGATLRSIAASAGVSAGLVRHHFGSKEGLREACDVYVLEFLRRETKRGLGEQGISDPGYLATLYEAAPPVINYLARALVDGSPAGKALFDETVAITEEALSALHSENPGPQEADRRAQAAVLTAMKLGITVLKDHLARALCGEAQDPRLWPRVSHAMLTILSRDLLGPDMTQQALEGLLGHQLRDRISRDLPGATSTEGRHHDD